MHATGERMFMKKQLLTNFKQLFFFGLVGVLTLIVDLIVTQSTFHLGVHAFWASACGFVSGFFVNFPLNRGKVFKHTENDRFSLTVQIFLFVLLSLFNLMATSAIVAYLVSSGLEIVIAKAIVTVVFFLWNFIVLRTLIFSSTSEKRTKV